MHRPPSSGKFSVENLPARPCMMGDADIALIDQILAKIPRNARLLEFGPWLGGISQRLAQHGELHVVDRFIWSDKNAENHPGVLESGESFQPLFETLMQQSNAQTTQNVCEIADFEWSGDPIDFCLIDAPRNSFDLGLCLAQVLPSLKSGGYVMVKHGLNPEHMDMMAMLDGLISTGTLALEHTEQPPWCNIAVLKAGPQLEHYIPSSPKELDELGFQLHFIDATTEVSTERLLLSIARLAFLASEGHTNQALTLLKQCPPNPKLLKIWDRFDAIISTTRDNEGVFAAFAEILTFHHGTLEKEFWAPPDQSLTWALRHAWSHYLRSGSSDVFSIESIATTFAKGGDLDLYSQSDEVDDVVS